MLKNYYCNIDAEKPCGDEPIKHVCMKSFRGKSVQKVSIHEKERSHIIGHAVGM